MCEDVSAMAPSKHFHAVRFYEDSQSLACVVARFIIEGLSADAPAIIITTPEHRDVILEALARSVDVERLTRQGDLVALDAEEALEELMVDGMPAREPFEEIVLPLIDKAVGSRKDCVVRLYGDMVDVLWKRGREAAAIRLEVVWNQLSGKRNVSTLCGYSIGNLYREGSFERICREHTHTVSPAGAATAIGPGGVI